MFNNKISRTVDKKIASTILFIIFIFIVNLNVSAQQEVKALKSPDRASPEQKPILADFRDPASTQNECVPLASSPSTAQNFILVNTPRIPITDAAYFSKSTICELNQTLQYFDGLGRPLQTVQVKASPMGGDIVQPIVYDAYGRETIKYLPYTTPPDQSNGSYKSNAVTDQASFYANPAGKQWNAQGVVSTLFPFMQTIHEPSPLNRVTEQGAAGDNW